MRRNNIGQAVKHRPVRYWGKRVIQSLINHSFVFTCIFCFIKRLISMGIKAVSGFPVLVFCNTQTYGAVSGQRKCDVRKGLSDCLCNFICFFLTYLYFVIITVYRQFSIQEKSPPDQQKGIGITYCIG